MGSDDNITWQAVPAPRDHFEYAESIRQFALAQGADEASAKLSAMCYLEHHGCLTDAHVPPKIRALLRKAYRTTIAPRFEAEKAQ
jgi:hypothetical protein